MLFLWCRTRRLAVIAINMAESAPQQNRGAILAQIEIENSKSVALCRVQAAGEYLEVAAPTPQNGLYVLDAPEDFDPTGAIIWGNLGYSAAADPENLQPGEFLWNSYAGTISLKPP